MDLLDAELTWTKLSDSRGWIAGIEVFRVHLVSVCGDRKGSSDVLDFAARTSKVKDNIPLGTVILDVEFGDLDSRIIQAACKTGCLENICTEDSDRQSPDSEQQAEPPPFNNHPPHASTTQTKRNPGLV